MALNSVNNSHLHDVVFADRHYINKLAKLKDLINYLDKAPRLPNQNFFMLIRPRGFGLSLTNEAIESLLVRDEMLLDHLQNKLDNSLDLSDLGSYEVIHLSFSNPKANTLSSFMLILQETIQRQCWEHHVKNKGALALVSDLRQQMLFLIRAISDNSKKQVVVLVDNYDVPIYSVRNIANPEERHEGQRHKAEPVIEPVEGPFFEGQPQGLDQERCDRESEDEIGHAALGQRPRKEDFQQIEVEDRGVDGHGGRKDPVQQDFEDARRAETSLVPAVEHHHEEGRHGEELRHEEEIGGEVRDPAGVAEPEDVGRRPEDRLEEPVGDVGEEHGQHRRTQIDQSIGHEAFVGHGPTAGQQGQRREDRKGDDGLRRFDPFGQPRPEEERHQRRPGHPVDAAPDAASGQPVDDEQQQGAPPQHQHPGAVGILVGFQTDDQRHGQGQQQQQLQRMAAYDGHQPLPELRNALSKIPLHDSAVFGFYRINIGRTESELRISRRCAGARPRTTSRPRRPRR